MLGRLAYQTDASGTVLATFTYDSTGVPVSVQVGSDPSTAPRYYYVYNGHGDTVALVDAAGTTVASYGYDPFGLLMSDTESFANGWSNPYRYDGRDGVRYDPETGLYWMQVRAYDPALGRFLARDPLGRSPLFFADQPYVYAGNNPLINVDPSGEMTTPGDGGGYQMDWWRYPTWGFPLSGYVDFPQNTRGWTHIPRSIMRTLAGRIVWAQNNIVGNGNKEPGGPGTRFLRGGKRWPWPTFGGAAIWYNSIATKGIRYGPPSPIFQSAGTGSHVEDQAINWAFTQVSGLVRQWGDKAWNAEIDVHLMATLPPCGKGTNGCSRNYLEGVWLRQLLAAVSRKLPGAIGGSTGIIIKLWVWVIEPANPNNPYGPSELHIWGEPQYTRADLAIWLGFPGYIFRS